MNDPDIQAAKQRCEAATEGEWKLVRSPHSDRTMISSNSGKVIGAIIGIKDAEFIVHARSDLPAALEALEEAQEWLRIRSFDTGRNDLAWVIADLEREITQLQHPRREQMSDTVECPHGPDPSTFEMCSDCMNSWYGRVDDLERQLAEAQKALALKAVVMVSGEMVPRAALDEAAEREVGLREQLQSWEEGSHPSVVELQRQLRETQRRAQRYADRLDSTEEAGEGLASECANVDASLQERAEAVRVWNAALAPAQGKEKE